jgi:hypothetical protein
MPRSFSTTPDVSGGSRKVGVATELDVLALIALTAESRQTLMQKVVVKTLMTLDVNGDGYPSPACSLVLITREVEDGGY